MLHEHCVETLCCAVLYTAVSRCAVLCCTVSCRIVSCLVQCLCGVQSEVMVTAGANQAFTNVVLTLLDSASKAVLFKPYYFNHLMAIQMTGGADNVILGR